MLLAIYRTPAASARPAVGAHDFSTGNALVAEIATTFFLVFVIYGVAVDKRGAFKYPRRAPDRAQRSRISVLAIGAVSGGALNPARWFGPALVSGTWDNFWIWILGPAVGAVLAGLAYDKLLLKGTEGE